MRRPSRMTSALPGLSSVEYILTNPDSSFPTRFPELGASFEDPTHSYNAIEFTFDRRFSQQLVAARQLPLVAAPRQLRGLLPRGQRPVGPRDHVAL